MNQDIDDAMQDLEDRKKVFCDNKYKQMVAKAVKQGKNPSNVAQVTIIKMSEYDAWNRFYEIFESPDIGLPMNFFVVAFHRRFAKKQIYFYNEYQPQNIGS